VPDAPPESGTAVAARADAASTEDALSDELSKALTREPLDRRQPPMFPPSGRLRTTRVLALVLAGLALVGVAIAGAQRWRSTLGLVRTDNAQTRGDIVSVSSRVSGTITRVLVGENQQVAAGAPLLVLDDGDTRQELAHVQARLAAAEAQVQAARAALAAQQQEFESGLRVARATIEATQPKLPQAQAQALMDERATAARVDQSRARVAVAEANVRAAKAMLDVAARTLARNRELIGQGALAAQVVDSDTAAFEEARARHEAAQQGLNQAQAELAGAEASRQQVVIQRQTVAVNRAEIARAEAVLDQAAGREALVRQRIQELAAAEARVADATAGVRIAEINLGRSTVRAPSGGWVTNLNARAGQAIAPNQPLMALALARQVWVVANVKETTIGFIRVGDPVIVKIDAYPRRSFRGRVESIGAVTGASTALLPPDNASGNFVKVVQLVPVRIALTEPSDPSAPLRIGLSAAVAIDTRQRTR
jgi:membrane fusion protein (multidrug efflux system)